MGPDSNLSRREALGSIGGLGTFALAGCLGGGDSESTVTVGMGTGGTSEQMTQALQRVVDEEADGLQFITNGTSGDPENVRLYNDGDVDGYTGNNSSIIAAMNDEEPFAERPVEELAAQGILLHTFHFHWLAVDGSGIETTDDLAGKNVWPLQPDWGIRQLAETVHKNAGMWEDLSENTVDIDAGDVAGAIDEGRVDAFIGYGANFTGLPSWLSEVDARGSIHALEVTDTLQEGIEQTSGLSPKEVDTYGYEQDVGADTLTVWDEPGQLWLGESVSDDAAYEIARVSHEHIEQVREGQATYPDHSDLSLMTSGYSPDLPVHPGVAEFLRENDAWNEEWTEGKSHS